MKIEYSLDNGTDWTTIIASTPSTGIYSWTVPDTTSGQAKVRVSNAADASVNDISDAVFTITASSKITVVSPNGGESWEGKSVHPITWTSTNVTNVKIEYSLNNGSTWSTIAALAPAASGTYNWTVPDTTSAQALVRISDATNSSVSDVSDADFTITPVTSVDDYFNSTIPKAYGLMQNFPNPFNPTTTIYYSIPKSGLVVLKVYNILGKEVATLVNRDQSAGNYSIQFDASKLESGIYFYRIQSGSFVAAKKLILMK